MCRNLVVKFVRSRVRTVQDDQVVVPSHRLMWSAPADEQPGTSHFQSSSDNTPLLNGFSTNIAADDVTVRSPPHCCKSPSLLLTLLRVFGPTMAQAHVCELIGDIMIFCGPLLQRFVFHFRQMCSSVCLHRFYYGAAVCQWS